MSVRIYSFTSGRPDLLPYQKKTFAHFLEDDHELIVINDADDDATAHVVDKMAVELGLRCWSARPEVPTGEPSESLARAMQLAFHALIRFDPDISVLIHGDVFACRPFSLRQLLGGADLLAAPEFKASTTASSSVFYPWSGFIALRSGAFRDPEQVRFAPGTLAGIACDVPAMLWHYLDAHPEVRVRAVEHTTPISATQGNLYLLPGSNAPVSGGRGVEIVANAMLHYLGATGWYGEDTEHHRKKEAWLFDLIDCLLAGEVTMPLEQPSTSAWPDH